MRVRFLHFLRLLVLAALLLPLQTWAGEEGEKASAEKPKPKESGPPKEGGEEGGEGKSEGEPSQFIKLPTFIIPVIQDRQLVTAYSVDITIETTSKEIAHEVHPFKPRLIDALFADMYSVFCLVWSPDTRVLLKDLKSRLLRVSQKVAGTKRIRSVLIQNFGEQFNRRGP